MSEPGRDTPLRRARVATATSFVALGFGFSSWAARIPQVKAHERLSPGSLGLVLLAIAVGSVTALPLAGSIVSRIGSRATVAVAATGQGAALALVSVGYVVNLAILVVGLFAFGFAMGAWDVAMNVQGARIEHDLGRAILPRFHAGYSVGTVAGAIVGAAAILLGVPLVPDLIATGVLIALVVPRSARAYLPHDRPASTDADGTDGTDGADPTPHPRRRTHWTERRTLLIGVVVLAFTFAEGTGNDWISVGLIEGYHVSTTVGTTGFSVFLAAMTAGRWFGPHLLNRFGPVAVLRCLCVVAVAGLGLYSFAPDVVLACVGAGLWGLGVCLGFPVGMSAAADNPQLAAGRVSVVASVGYCAFLAGPPLVGFIGDHLSVHHGVALVAALMVVAGVLAAALRPQQRSAE
jgi:MFS family permease